MNADEIVRKIVNLTDAWCTDYEYGDTCFFCSEDKPTHAADCLWLEIEAYANTCGAPALVLDVLVRCQKAKGHDGPHYHRGNLAAIQEHVCSWDDDTSFFSNDPPIVAAHAATNDHHADSSGA